MENLVLDWTVSGDDARYWGLNFSAAKAAANDTDSVCTDGDPIKFGLVARLNRPGVGTGD